MAIISISRQYVVVEALKLLHVIKQKHKNEFHIIMYSILINKTDANVSLKIHIQ